MMNNEAIVMNRENSLLIKLFLLVLVINITMAASVIFAAEKETKATKNTAMPAPPAGPYRSVNNLPQSNPVIVQSAPPVIPAPEAPVNNLPPVTSKSDKAEESKDKYAQAPFPVPQSSPPGFNPPGFNPRQWTPPVPPQWAQQPPQMPEWMKQQQQRAQQPPQMPEWMKQQQQRAQQPPQMPEWMKQQQQRAYQRPVMPPTYQPYGQYGRPPVWGYQNFQQYRRW